MNLPARLLSLLLLLCALPATVRAEEPDVFAEKPYKFRRDDLDKRFEKTRLFEALKQPPKDPACARVVATMLAAFAEAAPYFHKKDEQFFLFQTLIAPIHSESFPAADYLREMVRYSYLEHKAPEAWLETAKVLKKRFQAPIDLERLAYAVDGPALIDSIYFSLQLFLERYRTEVELAPSLAQGSSLQRFRDKYLDRDLAWGGLMLVDVHKLDPPARPKGKKAPVAEDEDEEDAGPAYVATLIVPQLQAPSDGGLFQQKRREPIRIFVKLQPTQYLDLKKAVRSGLYVVRGRLWEMAVGDGTPNTPPMTIEIREGLLFEDHDWSRYGGFALPGDAASCDLCVNDLSPFGLKQKQGIGGEDGFGHQ